ncbi:DUF924 family protein [Bowmanella dokdonensis]|uniref:DUF924 domain-containing protein n=1 Tax=Bowmanella dokdonensis TaxID=751969 RepID=A0A939IQD8_9ALTE|nr:DUF924 family protein [Bowmanella dokdonensis]MBN7824924.1 DUF924 domain-containing protein [Bowmanella dokdonensis]
MNKQIERIYQFWFGEISDELAPKEKQQLWYASTKRLDKQIEAEFSELLTEAAEGKHDDWKDSAKGRLALILLFDQFSRNIYRGKPQAFAFDSLALALCNEGREKQQDKQLSLVERLFFYHPLEHAEDLPSQECCVELFQMLAEQYPDGAQHQAAANALKYAIEHRDIIARFGRFPHRNEVLVRPSTKEELDYLDKGGKRFGQ